MPTEIILRLKYALQGFIGALTSGFCFACKDNLLGRYQSALIGLHDIFFGVIDQRTHLLNLIDQLTGFKSFLYDGLYRQLDIGDSASSLYLSYRRYISLQNWCTSCIHVP